MVGPSRPAALLVAAMALVAAVACNRGPALSNIGGVEALQQRFDQDAGKPRVVLLLSPT